jgi:hypothetical protein
MSVCSSDDVLETKNVAKTPEPGDEHVRTTARPPDGFARIGIQLSIEEILGAGILHALKIVVVGGL